MISCLFWITKQSHAVSMKSILVCYYRLIFSLLSSPCLLNNSVISFLSMCKCCNYWNSNIGKPPILFHVHIFYLVFLKSVVHLIFIFQQWFLYKLFRFDTRMCLLIIVCHIYCCICPTKMSMANFSYRFCMCMCVLVICSV